jgi:tetratricopeptide (TPR) repeat protein
MTSVVTKALGCRRKIDWPVAAGLALLVAVAYVQVLGFEFVNYDDKAFVPENPHVRTGFSLGNIGWAFTSFETANWYPLTWLSLMLDCQMFGPRPGGHHAVSAILHAANAIVLFIVLRRMTLARWRSAAVAALFAVHPLHVESVAWIAERKDVLSTFFFLLTLLAYQRYAARPGFGRWLLVFLGMALGLMAKAMLVTLPAVLLLLDFWPLRRGAGVAGSRERGAGGGEQGAGRHGDTETRSRFILRPSSFILFLEKLPLLALSLAIAAVTLAAQSSQGATAMLHDRAVLPLRLANAAIAYVKYLAMTVWPADLAVYYPYDFHPSPWQAAGAVLLLPAITAGAVWSARRAPHLTVGWFWYLGTLVPVIGLVQVGSQAMADRYDYIPSIGIFLAAVWAVGDLLPGISQRMASDSMLHPPCVEKCGRILLVGAGVAILAALLVAAHHQASCWIDSERLFRHALAITGDNPVACENLGDALLKQEKYAAAEAQFRKVLALAPEDHRDTPSELAQALEKQGRIDEAAACLGEAIRVGPNNARAMNDLALLIAPRGHVAEAIALLQAAIKLAPQQPAGLKNLAWIYATCPDRRFRNGPQAVELARRACELTGWNAAPYRQALADAYVEAGDADRAIAELRAVIELRPSDPAAAKQLESLQRQRR